MQLSLFNRFSIWEDENGDESEVDEGSDGLDHSFGENGSDGLTRSTKKSEKQVEGSRTA